MERDYANLFFRDIDAQGFIDQVEADGKSIDEIKDQTNSSGVSLLGSALSYRKFDVARLLLKHNAKVNVVSTNGNNELHLIAAHIHQDGALSIAKTLVERGVSLTQQDLKCGNSAMFTLCMEVFKSRTDEENAFIVDCLKKFTHLDDTNRFGYSVRSIIMDRGNEDMKKVLEER